jgi:pyruvate kinase
MLQSKKNDCFPHSALEYGAASAAIDGNATAMKTLLNAAGDRELSAKALEWMLQSATRARNPTETVRIILHGGAPTNIVRVNSDPALINAAWNNKIDIIVVLTKTGLMSMLTSLTLMPLLWLRRRVVI